MATFIVVPTRTSANYNLALDINQLMENIMARMIRPGAVVATARSTPDDEYLFCNGASLLRASYPELFAAIGTAFGSVDGTHFTLPDFRGIAPVGIGTSGINSDWVGPSLGASQNDQMQGHRHQFNGVVNDTYATGSSGNPYYYNRGTVEVSDPVTDGTNGTPRKGKYTRAPGIGVNWQIKF